MTSPSDTPPGGPPPGGPPPGGPSPGDVGLDGPERVRRVAVSVAALARNGLTFAQDPYDLDRYTQLRTLAGELLSVLSQRPAPELLLELDRDTGYATPKVDVRGVLVDDQERLLLMRERSDGLWSLPGGWADPLDTPSRAVVREIREETGHGAEAVKLVACWDRDVQGQLPRMPVGVYKLFFLCRPTGDVQPPAALETLDVGWFALSDLPPLSTGRVTARQLARALAHHHDPSLPTEFD